MASCVTSAKPTRSGGSIVIHFEIEYPAIDNFDKLKLPTNKEIIGMVKKFKNSNSWEESINKVTHILQKHWIDRNVYPFAVKNIKAQVSMEVNLYKGLKKNKQEGQLQKTGKIRQVNSLKRKISYLIYIVKMLWQEKNKKRSMEFQCSQKAFNI